MPESHEKRQRARRKQRKRQEKLEARVARNFRKRNAGVESGGQPYYVLCRSDDEHLLDSVLWLATLNLASRHGWRPHTVDETGALAYVRPAGLHVSANEAEGLARSMEVELPELLDDQPELSDDIEFGEEYTELLVSMRIDGKSVGDDEVEATRAVLSGPAKKDARRLVTFLHEGEFWVEGG